MPSPPPSPDFRREVALARVGGDAGLLRELTADYLREAPAWLDALRRAVARGDAAEVRIVAHTIKGAVGYFGADEAGALADRLQELGRSGDVAGATAVFPQLEQALDRLGRRRALAPGQPPSLENLS